MYSWNTCTGESSSPLKEVTKLTIFLQPCQDDDTMITDLPQILDPTGIPAKLIKFCWSMYLAKRQSGHKSYE